MSEEKSSNSQNTGKKFLGIHFKCCNVYSRVYINDAGTAYEGYCPRCRKQIHIAIGQDGIASRFFEAH